LLLLLAWSWGVFSLYHDQLIQNCLHLLDDTASYFSFYDVCDKVGIVIGTLSFGLIAENVGGMRNSTISLSIYFVIGLILLFQLKEIKTSKLG
jgi:MFS-type transporter involved in bile tolerance (Atg22 family)